MARAKWIDAYQSELLAKPDLGEIEWRFDCFKEYVIHKGLGWPKSLVRAEKNRTDIRISTLDGLSHIVCETKIDDADLDKQETLAQAQGYLQGGESFLVLASPLRIRLFTPKGTHISDLPITEAGLAGSGSFWQLSYDFMVKKGHLIPFREGTFDYCYIDVHTPEGFKKFVDALQLCGSLLLRYLKKAWADHEQSYVEYQTKLAAIEAKRKAVEDTPISNEERAERTEILAREEAKLRTEYSVSIEVREVSFPAFQRIQPYSKDVASKELVDIYLSDITYAALNRLLFVRIAEDKGLVHRKVSNGGIGTWRAFVTYLKDKYQDLLQLAFRDASHIYEHFFEEGIFDWYVRSNSQLNEALENILFLLNAFDLSKVDRDTLGDLYQAYLNPAQRKKLGEFYTPTEVVDYILSHVGWSGTGTILDPACGSGGFLVRALNILLEDMKKRNLGDEARLGAVGRVAGLDINPFATHIAEMNLLFLVLDIYLEARQEAQKEGREFRLERLPVHNLDSLMGTAAGLNGGGTTRSLFMPLAQLGSLEQAIQARDKLEAYDYVVMNPPYVRNERLPQEPRQMYRQLFKDVAAMNADIFTYFMRKALFWLKDDTGKLGVIVSLSLADSGANEKLRKLLSAYTIEEIVPLEWCDVFVANVNAILLILKKAAPPEGHRLALVHGISNLKDLDQNKGEASNVEQERWLNLAPDNSWRVEVNENDLGVLEKMRTVPTRLVGHYGIEMGPRTGGETLIGDDPTSMKNPLPLLDGRDVKAWTIEWQNNFIDYQPNLIEAAKELAFFKAPKVLVRRISLTTQAAVDDTQKPVRLFRNTVMVVRSPLKELSDNPYVIAALVNSLPLRYYAFLMLRSGVIQQGYSNFYAGTIGNLPTPETAWKDNAIRSRLDSLSQRAHALAGEMVDGDRQMLEEMDELVGEAVIPFAQLPQSDLSGYMADVDVATAQVSETGDLTSSRMGVVKGHPAILQYMVSIAGLQGKVRLSKAAIEGFRVPANMGDCIEALHQMYIWAQRKPTLSTKVADIQAEIDDLVLSAFTVLSAEERKYVRERAKEFPLNRVLVADTPGAPAKKIPVKYWEMGERYKG